MSFQNGLYSITTPTGTIVNRSPIEDFSLLPKRVVSLPNADNLPMPPRPWVILSDDQGGYMLKAADSPTTSLDGKLFAVLLDQPPPTSWKFNPVPAVGENAYTINVGGRPEGWVVSSDEPYTQIAVRMLSGSDQPNEVFIIKPISN